jgi:hypothetical protein
MLAYIKKNSYLCTRKQETREIEQGPSEMEQVLRMQREQTNYLQTNLKKGTKNYGK